MQEPVGAPVPPPPAGKSVRRLTVALLVVQSVGALLESLVAALRANRS